MARRRPPDWDDDSAALRRNLAKLATSIERDAARRALPTLNMAKQWHRRIMAGLAVQEPQMVGRFRGEAGLEDCWVQVDGAYGSAPERVGAEAKAFEAALQRRLALLDATYRDALSVDADAQSAAIELGACGVDPHPSVCQRQRAHRAHLGQRDPDALRVAARRGTASAAWR